MSLMSSMNIGVTGMKTSQIGINTTAHNLANIYTEGYVRQQVSFADANYNTYGNSALGNWKVGLGVVASETRHIRDLLLDKAYREQAGRENFYSAQYEAIGEVEQVLGELNEVAFQKSLNDLWEGLSEIAKAPDDVPALSGLVMNADEFVTRVNLISSQLNAYQENLNQEVIDSVARINELADQIFKLGREIRGIESIGVENANDYRDARDLALDELAKLIDIEYTDHGDGFISVRAEGVEFITESGVYYMGTEVLDVDKESNYLTPYWPHLSNEDSGEYYEVFALETNINSMKGNDIGRLKGVLLSRGDFVADYSYIPIIPEEPENPGNPPVQGSYPSTPEGQAQYQADLAEYNQKKQEFDDYWNITYKLYYGDDGTGKINGLIAEYNRTIDASVIMKTQALFDQLVNSIVTTINDTLCPNTEQTMSGGVKLTIKAGDNVNQIPKDLKAAVEQSLTSEGKNLSDYINEIGTVTQDIEFTLTQDMDLLMLDKDNCGVGHDGEIGEELFSRDNTTARYTIITGANGEEYYVYNPNNVFGTAGKYSIGNLEINQAILEKTSALGMWDKEGAANYELANKIIDVWNGTTLNLDPNNLTDKDFTDYYSAMVDVLANDGYVYKAVSENQGAVVSDLDDARQAYMGVSSEEELTNLIKFQNAYNANSRFINTVADMIDTLINRVGVR